MPEYIEREALKAEALRLTGASEFAFDYCFPYWQFSKCIKEAPAVDAVPVVRCKDCKHNGTWQCHMEYDEYHPEADIHHEMHGDDDFCSYGVKEDGESNDE